MFSLSFGISLSEFVVNGDRWSDTSDLVLMMPNEARVSFGLVMSSSAKVCGLVAGLWRKEF